jgi:hypothetical protein
LRIVIFSPIFFLFSLNLSMLFSGKNPIRRALKFQRLFLFQWEATMPV